MKSIIKYMIILWKNFIVIYIQKGSYLMIKKFIEIPVSIYG